jgi:hypothetical protein
LWIFVGLAAFGLVLYLLGIRLTKADLAISAAAEPMWCFGGHLEGEHCSPETILPITNALIMTVVVDLLLLLTIVFGARNMQLIPRGFQNVVEGMVEAFYNFAQSVDRKKNRQVLPAMRDDLLLRSLLQPVRAGAGRRQHRRLCRRARRRDREYSRRRRTCRGGKALSVFRGLPRLLRKRPRGLILARA